MRMANLSAGAALLLLTAIALPVWAQTDEAPTPTIWGHSVEVDRMDDSINCRVSPNSKGGPFVWFFYHSVEGPSATVVLAEKYPGEKITWRVNKNAPIKSDEYAGGSAIQKLVSQIRGGGKTLLVEYIEWPSGAPEYLEYELDGIVEHLDACKAAVARK